MSNRLVNTALGFALKLDSNDYITKLLLKDKLFEAPESEVVTHILRPHDICVDAGCQVGYYTCLFTRLVGESGRVYAFDANPQICEVAKSNLALNNLHCAEVKHAALADRSGEVSFHISNDDQTGLSSLGAIAELKDTITVPSLRLEDFLNERKVEHVRLLKIDVEGSEESVLRGLGHFLTDLKVDFILAECYDERLKLLNTSTEHVWAMLNAAGYIAWQYKGSTGWSPTTEVRSRGDCNYLFVSPSVRETIPRVSIAGALIEAQADVGTAHEALAATKDVMGSLQRGLDEARCDVSTLHETLAVAQDKIASLRRSVDESRDRNEDLRQILHAIQDSTGWRVLSRCRRMRDVIAPQGSMRRRMYDVFARMLRG